MVKGRVGTEQILGLRGKAMSAVFFFWICCDVCKSPDAVPLTGYFLYSLQNCVT